MSTLRNQVQLLGFVGNDPEVRSTGTGKKVANFRIATSDSYRDSNGQWQTESTWHSIVAWEGLAERIEQQIKKGSYVVLTGKLTYRSYTDSNGVNKTIAEIRMDSFISLDRNHKSSETTEAAASNPPDSFTDDLPF